MEEFIYVAVAIGWMLFNAYRKSQANKETEQRGPKRAPKQEPASPRPTSLEEMMKELMGETVEQQAPAPIPVPASRPVAQKAHVHVPPSPPAPRISRLRPRPETRRSVNEPRESDETHQHPANEVHSSFQFDLRNAVISNAILQRPYA